MKVSVYLHKEIIETLRCFGNLDEVVNHILDDMSANYSLTDLPACPDRTNAQRCTVDITNTEYLELLSTFGPTSPRVSLRRIIYYFVENELYTEFGWEFKNEYVSIANTNFNKKVANAITSLEMSKKYAKSESTKDTLNSICNTLKQLLR